jgi:hypothetical protein
VRDSVTFYLDAWFGDVKKVVELHMPYGAGGSSYWISIDRRIQGQAVLHGDGIWRTFLNGKSILSPEDTEVIIEFLKANHTDE